MIDFLRGTITPKDWMAVGVMAAILALVCAIFVFFVHNRQLRALDELTLKTAQTRAEMLAAEETERRFEELRARTEKTQTLVKEFEKRLPGEAEIARLLKQFEEMANQVGLAVELQTKKRSKDERKETIPYGIVARGTFDQIASFVNRIERYERYLAVSDIEIKEEKDGVAEATFTLSTFRFLMPTNTGAQPSAQTSGT
ncbi:MAG TPA: type 4a pilus biogenesis protein PilO [Candidatus Hydrogenedentes bacterium]|nr:type 4a pilus biogenesis protein PilO [Candidatus Hydrogenedentota bacterium]HOS02060.1 type 4a pilus biogenesis protein PilO [Candidatus Hydrogenedentota bacterium]